MVMAEDIEVRRKVWEARVPVCFTLSAREICTIQQPEPYYIMTPRISYFPLVIDKVIKHFSRFVTEYRQHSNDLWIDFEGQPLKWHYPIGLLWDLITLNRTGPTVPLQLTLHFENFPEEDLIRFNNRSLVESMFMSAIKEADALKHKGDVIRCMLEREHSQLWSSLQNDKYEQFWEVNRKLMEHTNNEQFRHIPFRLYEKDKPFIQKPIKPTSDEGQLMTVGDLLKQSSLGNTHGEKSVYTHGIRLPPETPLQWLSENMSYPDNFLHLCLVTQS